MIVKVSHSVMPDLCSLSHLFVFCPIVSNVSLSANVSESGNTKANFNQSIIPLFEDRLIFQGFRLSWLQSSHIQISASGIVVLLKPPRNHGYIFPTLFCKNKHLMRSITVIVEHGMLSKSKL